MSIESLIADATRWRDSPLSFPARAEDVLALAARLAETEGREQMLLRRCDELEDERNASDERLADIEAQNRVMWDVANDREARLAKAEALLRECRHFVKALCDHDDATCGCYQHIVLRGIDAFLTADSAEAAVCVGCEGKPQYPNNPCVVCGKADWQAAADQPNEKVK